MRNKTIVKMLLAVAAFAIVGTVVLATTSCSAVRTITNRSEFYQRGDTSIMIQTKTIESYDASKKL